ncbi:MAG: hypothetical protein V7K57_01725 [Nostoc sp.]|uniref:hypothetical protein n=1 Tax=Nostoc sp. TaxID=1180 RepID=UPI002FFA00FA
MDIQSTLTQAIEFIVMSFVALIIFDFIDGLYLVPLPAIAITQFNANSESTVLPQQIPLVTTPQFEEIPDPWTLEIDRYNSNISSQAVIIPFPRLRLLPPVKEIKQQSKSTKNTKNFQKSHPGVKQKSSDLTDVGLKVKRKPGRPRKVA